MQSILWGRLVSGEASEYSESADWTQWANPRTGSKVYLSQNFIFSNFYFPKFWISKVFKKRLAVCGTKSRALSALAEHQKNNLWKRRKQIRKIGHPSCSGLKAMCLQNFGFVWNHIQKRYSKLLLNNLNDDAKYEYRAGRDQCALSLSLSRWSHSLAIFTNAYQADW